MIATARSTHSQMSHLSRASQNRFAWLALCVMVGLGVLLYLSLSLSVSAHPLLLPLDDSYIHFNYARQLAHGHPMIYSPGDPPTSGGTSLLYPWLLAVGYLLGFGGWTLSYWALGVGVMSFLGSSWLVYSVGRANPWVASQGTNHGVALLIALAFAASGPLMWAALSGMETAPFLFATLLALYALQRQRFRLMIGASLLAVILRPEGIIIAGGAILAWLVMFPVPANRFARFRMAAWLLVPVAGSLVQPAINWAVTDSPSSSGMAAKSHLSNGSVPLATRLSTILEQWGRLWREMLTGRSPEHGEYLPVLLIALTLLAVGWTLIAAWRQRRTARWRAIIQEVSIPAVVVVWMIGLSVAVALLDTAFWQFKRYQLPMMALFYPLGAWGGSLLGDRLAARTGARWARWIVPGMIWVSSIVSLIAFAGYYRDNVRVVRDQQVKMAQWVRDHVPQEARLGVHDVGLLRYFGERKLYDVVGLTTPGPAESWRQGPGAIYEHMASSNYRPQMFAIYPAVQGLGYLVDAGVFGDILAEFRVDLPSHTVASAADVQTVYFADWSNTLAEEAIAQKSTLDYISLLKDATLVDQIDVANLQSEAAHNYRWWQNDLPAGFVTEVYRHDYYACSLPELIGCRATDGGRVLSGGEEFTIRSAPGQDVLLVTRVHGRSSAPLIVSWDGGRRSVRSTQPQVPGQWVEIVTLLPGETISSESTRIRVSLDQQIPSPRLYMPYYHWAYQGKFEAVDTADLPVLATFGETGTIRLNRVTITEGPSQISLEVAWSRVGHLPPSDGVVFVHLYAEGALASPPVAQVVERPVYGVLPPENWLPGVLEESHTIALPDQLSPGVYHLALGFYDAISGSRYPVSSYTFAVDDRRLLVGDIVIEESEQ